MWNISFVSSQKCFGYFTGVIWFALNLIILFIIYTIIGATQCPAGYYGAQCEYKCHCFNGDACGHSTGVCMNGQCAKGWAGVDCQQGTHK